VNKPHPLMKVRQFICCSPKRSRRVKLHVCCQSATRSTLHWWRKFKLLASLLIFAASAWLIMMSQGLPAHRPYTLHAQGFRPYPRVVVHQKRRFSRKRPSPFPPHGPGSRKPVRKGPLRLRPQCRDQARLKRKPPAVHKEPAEGFFFLTRILGLLHRGDDQNIFREQAFGRATPAT
jgi:hypothetical protein